MTVGHPAEPWRALAGQPLLIKNLENNFLCRMKPFHVFNSEKSFVSFLVPTAHKCLFCLFTQTQFNTSQLVDRVLEGL